MKAIFKYTHSVAERVLLNIPRGAVLRKVDRDTRDPDNLAFWFEVDTDEAVSRQVPFIVVGTGNAIPDEAVKYIDSVRMGAFIWHIYGTILF